MIQTTLFGRPAGKRRRLLPAGAGAGAGDQEEKDEDEGRPVVLTGDDLPGGLIHVIPGLVKADAADRILAALLALPWEQNSVVVYGRSVPERRETLYLAEDPSMVYAYSGRKCVPAAFTPEVLEVKALAEAEAARITGAPAVRFNACLLNLYRDGTRVIGMHSDDESSLVRDSPIFAVSFGAARHFDVHARAPGGKRVRLEVRHGTGLLMAGDTQRNYKHGIPQQATVKQPRVSLTFRSVVRPAE